MSRFIWYHIDSWYHLNTTPSLMQSYYVCSNTLLHSTIYILHNLNILNTIKIIIDTTQAPYNTSHENNTNSGC